MSIDVFTSGRRNFILKWFRWLVIVFLMIFVGFLFLMGVMFFGGFLRNVACVVFVLYFQSYGKMKLCRFCKL